MRSFIRTTAAATACAVALTAVPAGAETITRDTKEHVVVERTCEWEVDGKGNPILDEQGQPIPVTRNGKQICTEREVGAGSSGDTTSSGITSKWADNTRSELGIGAIVGVVGALVALVLGAGLLFIESVEIKPLPPRR